MSTTLELLTTLVAGCRAAAEASPENAPSKAMLSCVYFANNVEDRRVLDYTAPICIVGHAIAGLGVEQAEELVPDVHTNSKQVNTLFPWLRHSQEEEALALHWLITAQNVQDRGKSWAEAVLAADESMPEE